MNKPQTRIIDLTVEDLKEIIEETIKNINLTPPASKLISTKITLTALCEVYGWAKPTVYAWCSQRKIPHSKVGKQLWFDKVEIEFWISENRVKTKAQLEHDYEIKK